MEVDYKKLNLKCGLEIHVQLNTKNKLFCNCLATMKEKNPIMLIERKQHPVASELGEIDVAAQYEFTRDRVFYYQVFPNEVCLVCTDEEPPHDLNQEALEIALNIALLMNCKIPDEIHVMRKTLIDGSAICGFQRTAIIGINGFINYKGKKVEIKHISLEEDSAGIFSEEEKKVTYKLNRLGIPLVEIATGILSDFTPEEIEDIAKLIGAICYSTGKVKTEIGSIRQDVNVSIRNGPRVEIKGIQELGLIAKVIELEIQRQLSLENVKEETRSANPDGTTRYTRPLPGAARMYVETDLLPIPIKKEMILKIKKKLPETWDKKIYRLKKELKLSDELANQIVRSKYFHLFEEIVKKLKISPTVVANTFTNILKELKRRNIPVENIEDKEFIDMFKKIKDKKMAKEGISIVLEKMALEREKSLLELIEELNLSPISESELSKIVKEKIKENKERLVDARQAANLLMGLVMKEARGRIDGELVNKMVKKEVEEFFSRKA
ncbi:MAG: hypothetical protein QXX38_00470 [Candidatus Aenigmatarchaeota archaeon]